MSRTLDSDLVTHFGQEVTTIATCWRIERKDGTVLGFTNHDATITYDGVDYDPFSSAGISDLEQMADTEAGNVDIEIAFDSSYITKADVQAGRFDNAAVHVFLINYEDTSQGIVQLISGHLGEAETKEYGGKAEMVSIGHALLNRIGRTYEYRCDAVFGGTKCGVDADALEVSGTVTAVTDRAIFTDSGRSEDDDHFNYGVVTFTSGNNEDWTREVKDFGSGQFTAFAKFPYDISVGDTYTAKPGCDKYPATCKNTYDNFINFRGFPHLPGRDELTRYPDA